MKYPHAGLNKLLCQAAARLFTMRKETFYKCGLMLSFA